MEIARTIYLHIIMQGLLDNSKNPRNGGGGLIVETTSEERENMWGTPAGLQLANEGQYVN